jgi:hypothetical protein
MLHEHLHNRALLIGISTRSLAILTHISVGKLADYFKGRCELSDMAKAKELVQVLDDIQRLQRCFPISVSISDVKLLALAIERLRAGRFDAYETLTTTTNWETYVQPRKPIPDDYVPPVYVPPQQ